MAEPQYLIAGHALLAPKLEAGLYVVATPIGNLKDISLRALETLAGVDLILCEDTRTSSKLLNAYGISTQKASLHEHNEVGQAQSIVEQILGGKSVALISDAGTPLISDPGFPLVRAAAQAQISVVAIPGASAVLGGLSVSGLPTDSFSFFGFLPAKNKARQDRLSQLSSNVETMIFYESPKRAHATLVAMAKIFGDERQVVLARELTKRFETLYRGTAADLAQSFDGQAIKGEIVIVVGGAQKQQEIDPNEWKKVLIALMADMPLRGAVDSVAKDFGLKRKQVYQAALELRDEQ